jgi:AcrR family transcriptional regulator
LGQTAPAGEGLARRRQARGDRTRAALVDAALALFGRKGVDATAVDEITSAAAVAKGTFYVHFQRKQDVLLEVGGQLVFHVGEIDLDGPPAPALHRMADRLAARVEQLPRPVAGRMVREIIGSRDDWLRILGDRPTLARLIEPVIAEAQAQGTLRADQSATRLAQALTILWLDNIVGWAERPDPRPLARDLRLATDLFLDGAIPR